jgi:hypothetical protein
MGRCRFFGGHGRNFGKVYAWYAENMQAASGDQFFHFAGRSGEFTEWQTAHPDLEPSNGWRALGWGLLGTLMFLVVFFAVAIPIAMIFPSAFAVAIPIALIFLSAV